MPAAIARIAMIISRPVKLNFTNWSSPVRISQMLSNNMPILLVTLIFAMLITF